MKGQLPSIQSLKQKYIESNSSYNHRMLNCAAHMIIVIDNPKQLVQVDLEFMVTELDVCRADAGFATPSHDHYTPIAEFRSQATNPPSITGLALPNQHQVMQEIWHSTTPKIIDSVSSDSDLLDLRETFLEAGCKSILLQKLVWENEPMNINGANKKLSLCKHSAQNFLTLLRVLATTGSTLRCIACFLNRPSLN